MKPDCVLCHPSADEHMVLEHEKWRVILVDDFGYPGFCRVIWQAHVAEMTDLLMPDRQALMAVVLAVEKAIRDVMQPDKMNLASFGNMVPHLHWHIIPRFADDAHFPESIWGVRQRDPELAVLEKRRALMPQLKVAIRQILDTAPKAL